LRAGRLIHPTESVWFLTKYVELFLAHSAISMQVYVPSPRSHEKTKPVRASKANPAMDRRVDVCRNPADNYNSLVGEQMTKETDGHGLYCPRFLQAHVHVV
jgi:hypothetical protein